MWRQNQCVHMLLTLSVSWRLQPNTLTPLITDSVRSDGFEGCFLTWNKAITYLRSPQPFLASEARGELSLRDWKRSTGILIVMQMFQKPWMSSHEPSGCVWPSYVFLSLTDRSRMYLYHCRTSCDALRTTVGPTNPNPEHNNLFVLGHFLWPSVRPRRHRWPLWSFSTQIPDKYLFEHDRLTTGSNQIDKYVSVTSLYRTTCLARRCRHDNRNMHFLHLQFSGSAEAIESRSNPLRTYCHMWAAHLRSPSTSLTEYHHIKDNEKRHFWANDGFIAHSAPPIVSKEAYCFLHLHISFLSGDNRNY